MRLSIRLLWLLSGALLTHLCLGLAWFSAMLVQIAYLTSRQPQLAKILEQVNRQPSSLTVSSGDTERYFQLMAPVFQQMDWTLIALLASVLAFGTVGFLYGRWTGSCDSLGILVVGSLGSGQNPITMALQFSRQGVPGASLSHLVEVSLLVLQLVCIYTLADWGCRLKQRKSESGSSLTTRQP